MGALPGIQDLWQNGSGGTKKKKNGQATTQTAAQTATQNNDPPIAGALARAQERWGGSANSTTAVAGKSTNASDLLKGASAFVKAAQDKKASNDIAARTKELEALRKQRTQTALSMKSTGLGTNTGLGAGMTPKDPEEKKQLGKLDAVIRQKEDELKALEKELYGYGGNKLENAARRVGKTVSGAVKSVAGNVEETLGQLTNTHVRGDGDPGGSLGGWGSYAEMMAPPKTTEQLQAEQRALKEARFNKSDALSESAAEDLETAKAGLSVLGKTAVDLSSEGLKMAGDLAANVVVPGSGTAGLAIRAFGSGAQEARRAGATAEQQVLYGATVGGIEALTERMFAAALPLRKAYGGAARFAGKSLDDLLDAGIRKMTSNTIVQKLASSFLGEGLEEIVSDIANPYAKLIYDGGDALKKKFTTTEGFTDALAEELYDGLIGGLLGGFGGGVELAATGASNAAAGQRVIDSQSNFGLVELGLNYAEGSKSRKTAERIAAKLNAAEDITKSGVTVSEYGQLLREMQEETDARPTLNTKPSEQTVTETGAIVTQMSPVAEAFRAKGDDAATSVRKAQILARMMDGEPVSNKQLESLGLRDQSTQAVLTQLTGVEVPQGATNSELRKIFRTAAETATEARRATQELGQSISAAQDAIAEAQIANDARAEETAAQIMADAEQTVAAEDEADPGVLFENGTSVNRGDFREFVQKYFAARGEQITTEQADALYDRLKQYNETNGPVTGTLMGEVAAGEDAASDLNGFASETAQAFAVDTEAATGEADAAANTTDGTVTQEQQWTARYVKSALKDLGVKDVVYDGANLGSARAMVSDGVIYLNENRLDSQRTIMWAVGHELVHPGAKADTQLADTIIGAFQTMAESGALSEVVQYQVENIDDLIAEKTAAYKRYLVEERGKTPEQAAVTVTEAYIREEIAADWMGYVFENQNALERLAGIEPSLLTKALRAVRKIRSGGETELLNGGKTADEAEKRLAGLEQRLKSALLWADDTSRAPARPNPESVDTSGKNEYNKTAEATPESAEASPELQDVMDRLAKGEDVSLDEINRTPEVEEVHRLPSTNTADIRTPEREQLRTQVLEELYKRGSYSSETNDYTGEIAHDRRIDIVIGAPAAGKSSVLVNPLSEQHKSRVIDSDDAKQLLPEYNKGKGANNVHRESSGIRDKLKQIAMTRGENIVWPTVGDKLNKLLADIQTMKDNGYSVYLHLNELPAGKATGRALGRYLSEGRFVDPEIVLKVGDKPTQNYEYIRQQEGLIDGYSHYSNDVPRGEKPILIERSSETRRDVGSVLRETDAGGAERLVRPDDLGSRAGRGVRDAVRGTVQEDNGRGTARNSETGNSGRPLGRDRGRGVRQSGRSLGDAGEKEAGAGGSRYSIDSADYRGREDAGRTGEGRQAGGEPDERATLSRGDGSGNLAVYDRKLTPEIRAKATERGTPDLGLRETTDYAAYSQSLDAARTANRNGAMVDPQSVDGLTESGARTFLNGDGTAGVAVERDGNIVGVFKHPSNRTPRAARDLLLNALVNGGNHLDCYVLQPDVSAHNLGDIYSQLGFEPVAYLRFSREYADPDWDYASFGEPDVVMWVHNGDSVETVAERIGDYHYYSPEEIRETCRDFTNEGEDPYQAAKNYQLEQLNMRQTAQASEDAGAVSDSTPRFSVDTPLADQIAAANRQELPGDNAVYFGGTTNIMAEVGMDGSLPVLMTQQHIRDILHPKDVTNSRWHGLTEEQLAAIPEKLQNPVMVIDSMSKDAADGRVLFVTDMLDGDGLPIIAAVQAGGVGWYNMQITPTNMLLSVYGYGLTKDLAAFRSKNGLSADRNSQSFGNFVQRAMDSDSILYIGRDSLESLLRNNQAWLKENRKSQSREVPNGLYLPYGIQQLGFDTILHQSRNVVKSESEERFALDPDTEKHLTSIFDSEDFQGFLNDFFSGYGAAAIDNTVTATGGQRVSRVRSNTLEQTRRERIASVLGEERGKAISRILTLNEKHMDALGSENFTYDVETEKQSMARAKERLANDYAGTKTELENSTWHSGEDLDAAMGILAAELADARKTGNYDDAVEWARLIQEQGTGAGQFIHAFAKYTRTPEGVLVRAAETLDEAGVAPSLRNELLDRIADFTKTLGAIQEGNKDGLIDLIVEQAKQRNTKVGKTTMKHLRLQKYEYLYDAALNQMDQIAKDYVKASAGKKIATYQTMSHLMNPRTANRNASSNAAFGGVDSLANNVSMIPDAIMSIFTGRRTTGADAWVFSKDFWRGAKEGANRSQIEIALDINPDESTRDKYGTARRTWKKTGNFGARTMSGLEKVMGYELNWTDEFHKGGTRSEILKSLEPLVRRGHITMEEATAWADQEALYRSFQDETHVGKVLGLLKNGLNTIGIGKSGKKIGGLEIKEFGLGDFVQKYTQVPGALITRALEFSPTGYLKAIYCLAKFSSANKTAKTKIAAAERAQAESDAHPNRARATRNAFRAKNEAAQAQTAANQAQRMAALAIGRATTGTGLIVAFALASMKGLLKRADNEDDPDVKALHAAEGISGTQLNTSALARCLRGESTDWRDGDELISIEFLEPLNALMTMGAMVAKDNGENPEFKDWAENMGLDAINALWKSIQEIPTMQTLQTIENVSQYHEEDSKLAEPFEIVIEIAKGSVTGFIPSLIRQSAQAADTVYRETYGSKDTLDQTGAALQNSIPFARNQLSPKLDNFGQEKTLEDRVRNVMNAFVNPGSARTYRQSSVSKELDAVYQAGDEANIYPDRSAPYTVSFSRDKEDIKYELTASERQRYQRTRGTTTYRLMRDSMQDQLYRSLSTEDKSEVLSTIKQYSNYLAKKEFLSGKRENYSDDKYEKYTEALDTGMTLAQYLVVKSAVNDAEGEKDANGKTISGTKLNATMEVIDSFDLTPEQKDFLLYSAYPTTKKTGPWR